jgi:putative flavoprotein involved in K+ transport
MTQTLEPAPGSQAGPSPARQRVEQWLADFEAALAARDAKRAAGLFATTSFWRDLVAFTWNLKTVENRDGVADLLTETMERTDASNFAVTEGEEPEEADGVTTAYFTFETAVGRGSGLVRLTD